MHNKVSLITALALAQAAGAEVFKTSEADNQVMNKAKHRVHGDSLTRRRLMAQNSKPIEYVGLSKEQKEWNDAVEKKKQEKLQRKANREFKNDNQEAA